MKPMTPTPTGIDATAAVGTVRRAQFAHLVEQGKTAILTNALVAGVVVFVVHETTPTAMLSAWLALFAAVIVARLVVYRRAVRQEAETEVGPGLWRIVVLAWASGLIWGLAPWLFWNGTSGPGDRFVLLVSLAGLAAGAIPMLSCIWRVYLVYVGIIMLPVCLWFATGPESDQRALATVILMFVAALASAGRNYADNFQRIHELAAELSATNARAEAANAQLRAEVDATLRARDALSRSEQRFHTAFEQAPIGMALMHPDGRIFQANPMLAELLNWEGAIPEGTLLPDLLLDEDAGGFQATVAPLVRGEETRVRFDARFVRRDNRLLWASVAIGMVEEAPGTGRYFIVEVQDITESVELSARLHYEASHDELTDLTNRREFERRLVRLLRSRRRADTVHSLCYIDLDRFKVINDSQGHMAGDEVLRQIAGVLQQHLRAGDTVARLGGDEFALLLENCDADQALSVAENLVKAVHEFRFAWRDQLFRLDLSVGVAEIPSEQASVAEIMRAADTACSAAKEAGGGRAHVYRPEDREMVRRHGEIEWLARITHALDHGGFELYAQPIMASRTRLAGQGHRFEILLRLRGESERMLLPSAFLPAAERYGLATRIDRWVIAAVFEWFAAHPQLAAQVNSCSINLSGMSLDDQEFTDGLMQDIRSAPLAPEQLCFEVTETAAIGHLAQARRFMESVESLGCHFALDDFGSGLSSFGYLRSLPVDTLKIDGQFVRDIARDKVDHALVKSINDVGRVLGLVTVAEYVEDQQTLDSLRGIGVDFVQGHFLGAPVPLESLLPPEPLAVTS